MSGSEVVLRVKDLKKYFPVHRGVLSRVVAQVQAVDGVSFEIRVQTGYRADSRTRT
jgi:ABC-type oligopeptide transport system ATPase subunit